MVCDLLPPKTKKHLLLILAASRLTTEVKMCKIFKNQTDDNGKMLQVNICIKTFSCNGDFNQKYKSCWLLPQTSNRNITLLMFSRTDSTIQISMLNLEIISSWLQHLNLSFSVLINRPVQALGAYNFFLMIYLSRYLVKKLHIYFLACCTANDDNSQ